MAVRALIVLVLTPVVAVAIVLAATATAPGVDPPTIKPTGTVWGDRVFTERRDLARWLRYRGVKYQTWAERHPTLAARLRPRGARRGRPAAERRVAQRPTNAGRASFPLLAVLGAAALLVVAIAAAPMVRPGMRRLRRARPRLLPGLAFSHSLPQARREPRLEWRRTVAAARAAPAARALQTVVARSAERSLRAIDAGARAAVRHSSGGAATVARKLEHAAATRSEARRSTNGRAAAPRAPSEGRLGVHRRAAAEVETGHARGPAPTEAAGAPSASPGGTSPGPEATRVSTPAPPEDDVHPDAGESDSDEIFETVIDAWRGYVTSAFFAKVVGEDGAVYSLATSPAFRWWKTGLPAPTEEARAAHDALVAAVVAGGWEAKAPGPGEPWFALRFVRTREVDGGESNSAGSLTAAAV